MEGHIITPLDGAVLFAQQDAEHQEKQANEEAKQKSKTDAICLREHERVLAAGTKVFANPLASYNHKDDLLDIIATLGLDCAGTIAMLTERIQTYLASHPDITSQPHFSGVWPDESSQVVQTCAHGDGRPFTGSGWTFWVNLTVRVLSRILVPLPVVKCTLYLATFEKTSKFCAGQLPTRMPGSVPLAICDKM